MQPVLEGSPEVDRWRLEELTVNYRTPSQIASAAETVAISHHLSITPSRTVRSSEWPVETVTDAAVAVRRDLALGAGGTLAVIVVDSGLDALESTLRAEFGDLLGVGELGLGREIALLTPQDAKGLEFDAVIVVDPAAILTASERGAGALYVAMTRATQRLYLVGDAPLGDARTAAVVQSAVA